jgi:hypothetical protein
MKVPTLRALSIAVVLLLASQLLAATIFFATNWRRELFLARATHVSARLLAVNPDFQGYRVQIAYEAGGHRNHTSVLVRNPPAIHLGESLEVYVDPENFWRVEIPGEPVLSFGLLSASCGFFAFFAGLFVLMGAVAAGAVVHVAPSGMDAPASAEARAPREPLREAA